MSTYSRGTTAGLLVMWREYAPDGPLTDVDAIQVEITSIGTGATIIGPTSVGVLHPATGVYTYGWEISPVQAPGSYLVTWTGTAVGTGDPVSTSEVITVTAVPTNAPAGLCDEWTPMWSCPLPLDAPSVTGTAVDVASEVLFALSGRRFSLCSVTIRPCRRDCADVMPNDLGWWEYGNTYPQPALIRGRWYNLACGGCAGECSCSIVSEVALPEPVYDVVQVKVDGIPLTPGTDYRLDNHRLLVRLGGQLWPICNDLNLADTEVGTWSVTFRTGEPLTPLGQSALGVLATEFTKLLLCDDSCQLPKPVQSIARQGVNITFLDPNEVFADRRTGLYLPDLFISTYNPRGLTRRSRAYDIDAPYPRRTGT